MSINTRELYIPRDLNHQLASGAVDIACAYRHRENAWSGYVVVFGSEISGWVSALDYPQSWRPGCIAVDVDGQQWETVGGDAYHGAHAWQPLTAS